MIVCFKNFKRNKMVNLTATSIRHFLPDVKIYCYTLYKHDYVAEYSNQEPLHDYIRELTAPTKYVSTNNVHDCIDDTKTSGYANENNGVYFVEGYNLIYEAFEGCDEPILILGEDHFFTTGETLTELMNSDYDVAYGDWDSYGEYLRGNGSILCIVPTKVSHLFPMPESQGVSIEWLLGGALLKQIAPDRLHRLSTRDALNYHNDGMYTNSSETMINMMTEAGII